MGFPNSLTALSPLDGRYASKLDGLRDYLSEYALIRYRVTIEARWLQHLSAEAAIEELPALPDGVQDALNALVDRFAPADAERVKTLESTTNHDVKAVEYFLREKLDATGSADGSMHAFLHFACTSEDINNLAYALMLRDARERVLLPAIDALLDDLTTLAQRYAEFAMLSRTHGQAASPTTMGKELAVFAARLRRQHDALAGVGILGKFNGAVGNFNAHLAAYPELDWPGISASFIDSLGLEPNAYTTQIEPHDWIAEYCHAAMRCSAISMDLSRDLWAYISLGYFKSKPVDGEVGSSTMPHKVNPIEFENAEGNFGLANATLGHLAEKLAVSRWQRDLSDSTALRNLGVGLAHALLGFESCRRGIAKLEAHPERMAADLDDNWEVLAEAVQTVMRRYGIADAYEQLKSLTRGRGIDREALRAFIENLEIPAGERDRLLAMSPSDYIGAAATLAKRI